MAEFHPELTEKQRADRLLSLQLEALNIREAIAETKHQLDVLKWMDDDEIDTSDIPEVQDWFGAERGKFYRPVDQVVQTLVEKFGIDPDKLRITVIEHQTEAAPDLDIGVGTFEPTDPVFAAMNAMRNQFEHSSLRMVNRDESKDSRDPE